MATTVNLSDTAAETMANALAPLLNGGTINLYTGTQPATANTALSGNTLLATLNFGSPAFGNAAAGGVITANPISSGTAQATGTATFARLLKSDGTTVVMDMPVGVTGSGAALTINTTSIASGQIVQITAFSHTVTEQ